MTKQTTKARRRPAEAFTPAELRRVDLMSLMRLYRELWQSIARLTNLTDYGEYLHLPINNTLVPPLESTLMACLEAIKAATPKDQREMEWRCSLLYEHALHFNAPADERQSIASQALLASLPALKTKVEHILGHEVRTVKEGRRIVSRSYRKLPKQEQ
jgi:hypothetical protein